ncbi:hypothetical protein D0Z07_4287 [Hyphodiscus hymeniophilus]|uniref:Uncharacterized protein n=1 Tax=Hyphodiscus hymeniophilus TaxID=353542 RepID=A0A9P6VJP4_9HELO|nr:hypothetical protein D0Z07_4287 [Hyphodiscus hymeniophilus]
MVRTIVPGHITDQTTEQHKLAFIVSSSQDKPDPNARRFIRSHVMQGKNRRKRADQPESWINRKNGQHYDCIAHFDPYLPPPLRIWSDLPITEFALDMPPYGLDLVFNFFKVVGQEMYPIEAYFDMQRGHKSSTIQIQHGNETLVQLQRRLNDCQMAISDGTISVVVCLVMMTALVGDYDVSRKHMTGLYNMVKLRGGACHPGHYNWIFPSLIKPRADLIISLLTNHKPMLFSGDISWKAFIAKEQNARESVPNPFRGVDAKLCGVWADLREFTRSANLAFQTGQKIGCILFQEVLLSVLYRLLLFDVGTCPLDEAFLIGMLAFSTNIFLRMHGVTMRFETLSARFRTSTLGIQSLEHDDSLAGFKLWLLFVASMPIVADREDPWIKTELQKTLDHSSLTSWKAVSNNLKDYLWIGGLHDDGGKNAFEVARSHSSETLES